MTWSELWPETYPMPEIKRRERPVKVREHKKNKEFAREVIGLVYEPGVETQIINL